MVEQDECNVDNCFVEKKEEIYVSSLKVLKEYIVLKIYYNVMLKTKLVKSILIYENLCISRIGSRENDSIFDAKARLLLLDFDYNVMVIT